MAEATTDEPKPFWNRKTYCIVTGASQGIGRQIAIDFATNVGSGSAFLLLARNIDNLNETKRLLEEVNNGIQVFSHSVNFSEPIGLELHKIIALSLNVFKQEPSDYELAMIVHNAGSLGDLTESALEMKNVEKLESYLRLNLYSVIILNAEFLKIFDVDPQKTELAFINITSLCGVQPFPSMGYYCIGKSAREMYFGVFHKENKHLTVFSYSPGPVQTEMIDEIIATIQNDELKNLYLKMKDDSKLLLPKQTVARLVSILKKRAFTNGERKDYYDE